MSPDEEIVELAISLRPRGIAAHEIPAFVELLISVIRVEAMKWKYDPVTQQWLDTSGRPDTREHNGCKEIAEQGTMHVNTYSARPKSGDLRPSESMLRDMHAKAMEPVMRQREDLRRRIDELDRQIATGQLVVHPEATPGNGVSVPRENGGRMVVPEHKLTPADRFALDAERIAREFVPPPEHAPPVRRGPVESGADGATADERAKYFAALAKPGVAVGNGVVEVARLVDKAGPSDVIIPATPDPRPVRESDITSWDMNAFPCIPKGR